MFSKLYLVAEYGKFELFFGTFTGNSQFEYFFSPVIVLFFNMDTNKLFCYDQTVLYNEFILSSLGRYREIVVISGKEKEYFLSLKKYVYGRSLNDFVM